MNIYIYIYISIFCVYMYAYIQNECMYRERERAGAGERARATETRTLHLDDIFQPSGCRTAWHTEAPSGRDVRPLSGEAVEEWKCWIRTTGSQHPLMYVHPFIT